MDIFKEKIIKKLEKASLNKEICTFKNTNFSGINLNKLEINDGLFKDCIFNDLDTITSMYGCWFTNCEFLNCDFSNVDILNTKFLDCTLIECNFENSKMKDVSFEGGYKSNNKFPTDIDGENVYGIDNKISNIISDSSDVISKSFEETLADLGFIIENDDYIIPANKLKLIITKDVEYGENTWRIMLDVQDPNSNEFEIILSDTFTEDENIKDIISNIIDQGFEKTKNLDDYTEDFNLLTKYLGEN